jgi:hypothetical protein
MLDSRKMEILGNIAGACDGVLNKNQTWNTKFSCEGSPSYPGKTPGSFKSSKQYEYTMKIASRF